jgi:hypothetical protein
MIDTRMTLNYSGRADHAVATVRGRWAAGFGVACLLLVLPLALIVNLPYGYRLPLPQFTPGAATLCFLTVPLASIPGLVSCIRGLTRERYRKRSVWGLLMMATSWLIAFATAMEIAKAAVGAR